MIKRLLLLSVVLVAIDLLVNAVFDTAGLVTTSGPLFGIDLGLNFLLFCVFDPMEYLR